MTSYVARFDGVCGECLERIKPGDVIERVHNSTDYRHVRCPAPTLTAADLAPAERPCATCHLVHKGDCF